MNWLERLFEPPKKQDDWLKRLFATNLKDFDESKVKRDKNGQFASSRGSKSSNNNEREKVTKQTSEEIFGKNFIEYKGKPREAIEKLLSEKTGCVENAIHKEGIGDIDFVYGEGGIKGYGIAHIIEEWNNQGIDGLKFVRTIPDIIEYGVIDKRHEKFGRIYIDSEDNQAVVRLDWSGDKRNWLVTAYEVNKK